MTNLTTKKTGNKTKFIIVVLRHHGHNQNNILTTANSPIYWWAKGLGVFFENFFWKITKGNFQKMPKMKFLNLKPLQQTPHGLAAPVLILDIRLGYVLVLRRPQTLAQRSGKGVQCLSPRTCSTKDMR